MQPTYLKPKALSDRWGISTGTLGQWRWNGKGPHYLKMGRHIAYPLQDIEEFERIKRRRSTSENSPSLIQSRFSNQSDSAEKSDPKSAFLSNKNRRG